MVRPARRSPAPEGHSSPFGTKHFHHPIVGDLDLAYDTLDLAGEHGVEMTIYTAEPGSPTYEALRLLASWAVTLPAIGQPGDSPAHARNPALPSKDDSRRRLRPNPSNPRRIWWIPTTQPWALCKHAQKPPSPRLLSAPEASETPENGRIVGIEQETTIHRPPFGNSPTRPDRGPENRDLPPVPALPATVGDLRPVA
jgi:hypothetical protein